MFIEQKIRNVWGIIPTTFLITERKGRIFWMGGDGTNSAKLNCTYEKSRQKWAEEQSNIAQRNQWKELLGNNRPAQIVLVTCHEKSLWTFWKLLSYRHSKGIIERSLEVVPKTDVLEHCVHWRSRRWTLLPRHLIGIGLFSLIPFSCFSHQ